MKAYGKVVINEEVSDKEKMFSVEDARWLIEYPVEREMFVVKWELDLPARVRDLEEQGEKIFHTRCHIQNKICSVIINN
jgi:hypothetical protein